MSVQEPYQIGLYCSAVNSPHYVYHSIVLPLRGDGVDIVWSHYVKYSLLPDASATSPLSLLRWYHVAALLLFVWASYHQFRCHRILACLRQKHQHSHHNPQKPLPSLQQHTQDYGLPDGDWFTHVSSPHYFAEVLIYGALLLVECGTSMTSALWLPWTFVVGILTLSARQTHTWYLDKFEDYPESRKIIFPFFY